MGAFPTRIFQDLHVLSQGFYRPFIYEVVRQTRLSDHPERGVGNSWLNNQDVSFLFGNLETAYAIHAAFLTSLEAQFSQWPNPGWGGFAGAFRMLFSSLRTMISLMGSNPQQLSRQTYERLSALPEFIELVHQVTIVFLTSCTRVGNSSCICRTISITSTSAQSRFLIHLVQCEALPICAGQTFVSLYTVQYSKLTQLVKNCGEWVSSCDNDYFEKQELNEIIRDFEVFYQKSAAVKRSAVAVVDKIQFHRQCVVKLSKQFSVFQVEVFTHLISFFFCAFYFIFDSCLSLNFEMSFSIFFQAWLFKQNHHIRADMECQILLSATTVSQPQTVQVIVSSKYFATALHKATASASEIGDREAFLQNIATDALAPKTEVSLTMVDKVGVCFVIGMRF